MKAKPEMGLRLKNNRIIPAQAKALYRKLETFSWFYIGAEFCENLLPEPESCARFAANLLKHGAKVCLLTPPVSEKGLKILRATFRKISPLAEKFPGRFELTLNDFGAMEAASALCPAARLSTGRVLQENVFFRDRRDLKILNRGTWDFFAELGIRRFEISCSGPLPRLERGTTPPGAEFSITLHYPYFNLTSSRACLTGTEDIPPEKAIKGIDCLKQCLSCSFKLRHPAVREKLFISGNTLFIKFTLPPGATGRDLSKNRIDRLVYSPFP